MSKQRTCWKVITTTKHRYGERHSIIVSSKYGGINYPIKQWVRPKIKGSKLMVFKRKKDAISLALSSPIYKAVKCYVKGIQSKNVYVCPSITGIRSFWKMINKTKPKDIEELYRTSKRVCRTLQNTLFVDEVYCLE